jgi:hypothetical protein
LGNAYFNTGLIAGWSITNYGIEKWRDDDTKWYGMIAARKGDPDWPGWNEDVFLGAWNSSNNGTYVFKVDHDGKLTAIDADISGTVRV